MPEELKPCPFCGRKPEIRHNADGFSYVLCANDGCYARTDGCLNDNEAAKAWNCRVQQPNEPLTVDELRQMIGQWVWVESKDVLCSNGWYRVEPQFRETISLAGVDGTIYETSITNGDSAVYRRPLEAGEKG